MNKELRKILENIKDFFYKKEDIISIVYFGSLIRNSEDYFSDLDLIFYVKNYNVEETLLKDLSCIFKKLDYKILKKFKRYNKWIIYIYNPYIDYTAKVEFFISKEEKIKEDVIYLIQSRINLENLKRAILFDKGKTFYLLKKNWIDLEKNINNIIEESINSFLYYYDEFLLNFSRGDIFRAYMNYTITFYKLGALLSLSYGEYKNLYQPLELTKSIIKDKNLVNEYYEVSSDMEPLNMFYKKEKLVNLFFKTLDMISAQFKTKIDKESIKRFIKILDERYYLFYNFRDVSKIINFLYGYIKIKPKKLYRTASLDRYDYNLVNRYLRKKEIDIVLDLRTFEEIKNFKGRDINYTTLDYVYNEPIFLEENGISSYIETLKKNKESLKKIFENYLIHLKDKSLVLHCEHGQDRTGIIVALILDLLGIKREYILEDYKLSYGFTDERKLIKMFEYIDINFTNTENFLKEFCKINPNTLKTIKNCLTGAK